MGLDIVGAGLGRTGTASLKVALEELGVGRCYHMGEVLQDPSVIGEWLKAADGAPNWDQLLEGYSAAVDYPACTFWKELSDYYPHSRVVLSVRDAESWFESTNATIMSPRFNDFIADSPFGELVRRTVWDTLDGRMGDRDFMVSYFNRRIEEIREALPAERLLGFGVHAAEVGVAVAGNGDDAVLGHRAVFLEQRRFANLLIDSERRAFTRRQVLSGERGLVAAFFLKVGREWCQ